MRSPSCRATALVACALLVSLATSRAAQTRPTVSSSLFEATQLFDDLRVLSADEMQGRQFGTAGNARARAFLASRFKAAGLLPVREGYLQTFDVSPQGSGRPARRGANIVGRIDGRRQPVRYIVVSAHYDHIGVRNGRIFNGAGDNATGAAALLAVAQYFRAHPPANALLLVAFDGEEAGLAGSRAFVNAPPVAAGSLALNINADMLGRDSDDRLFVVGVTRQPFLRTHVEHVAAAAPVKLLIGHDDPKDASMEDWTERADHFPFMQAGIPALFVGVEDYPFYHQPTDDFETIQFDFYVRAVETLIALVREFDAHLDTLPGRAVVVGEAVGPAVPGVSPGATPGARPSVPA